MSRKLQIKSKNIPKWIPPEKRMKTYKEYGCTDENHDVSKVQFPKFLIVVPTKFDLEQLQAGFEFIHDNNSVMDNDFVVINCIAHSYLDSTREEGSIDCIKVDPKLYKKLLNEQSR